MLYDIHGNPIAVGGGGGSVSGEVGLANLSEEIINEFVVVDENTPIYNILDISKVSVGRFDGTTLNGGYTEYRTSDYIPVSGGQTYVAQAWDTRGGGYHDCIMLYDADKKFIQKATTKASGTIHYCIFTPEESGYIRYCYYHTATANPMVYVGIATTDTFVEYTGKTLSGEVMYGIAGKFKDMIRRDVEPSNLYRKTVYIIGDSNADNWVGGTSDYLEKRYGCKVVGLARYGATWETANGETDTALSNAIGQWNAFVSEVGISEDGYLFPDDVVLLFMMGTNCGNAGNMTDNVKDLAEDVSTAVGAQKYILRRAKYYGRNIAIGVFLPWCGATNEALAKIADYYKIPTFDIPAMVIDDTPTAGLTRPDGTTVSQNYFSDGGNHLSSWGWEMFKRIAHPWIAYEI